MSNLPQRKKNVRNRTQPFQMLVQILWHEHEWASWEGDTVTIRTGQMGRIMKQTSSRMREHFAWLAEKGYIANLQQDHGWVRFSPVYPPNHRTDFEISVDRVLVEHAEALVDLAKTDTAAYDRTKAEANFGPTHTLGWKAPQAVGGVGPGEFQKPIDKKRPLW